MMGARPQWYRQRGFTSVPVARSSNVDLLRVPHMAAHIFCLHAGGYEGNVYADTLEMTFAEIAVTLRHGHFHFSGARSDLRGWCRQRAVLPPQPHSHPYPHFPPEPFVKW